jgi:hypothetical protein
MIQKFTSVLVHVKGIPFFLIAYFAIKAPFRNDLPSPYDDITWMQPSPFPFTRQHEEIM